MKNKYDLSKENKLLPKHKVKMHLMLRRWIGEERYGKLAFVFDIGDNYPFWKLLHGNFGNSMIRECWEEAKAYYDDVQEWYHQWHLQEYKKNEWNHFYHGWQPKKTEFEDFWKELKKLPDVRSVNLAEIMRKNGGKYE